MKRPARPPTEERLMKSALHYLDRYGSSRENLRRVLERKVMRVAHELELDPADFTGMIASTVERCVRSGLVDDRLYAEARIASERRKGRSARRINAVLQAKGVESELAERLMAEEEGGDVAAACIAARKRRFGPWRKGKADADRQRKEIAALCRQGFSFGIARKVVEADDAERLLDESSPED
ncbi:regulatory protein RecX [Stappia sp. MMSF_3263]|uniref:regulatory protein RecX n=1 Tax=Stappia sp. MMSF_3263 TaxID=3046693 RepID=UPI00273F84B2|nr:regulatory protein RecX [Stappia sp. MMSF_3263]